MKKFFTAIIMVCVFATASMPAMASEGIFTWQQNLEALKEERMSLMQSQPEVVQVDMNEINLSRAEKNAEQDFQSGLVQQLRSEFNHEELTIETMKEKNTKLDRVISEYCTTHHDILSAKVYREALDTADSNNIIINMDKTSTAYQRYVKQYDVNGNMQITFTPDEIYVDECLEKPVNVSLSETPATPAAAWKYKNVAARRTLMKKVTVGKKTYSFSIYSVHTGGRIKYNGAKATHSADYYGYHLRQDYGTPFKFTVISKLKETYDGTGYHYKYVGKVSGSYTITNPVKVTISYKDSLLGCQVIVNKKGAVTKRHWPAV